MTKYRFLTKKIDSVFVGNGEHVQLEWTKISPLTADPAIRGMIPGEYAALGETVYIVPHSRPSSGRKRKKSNGNRH